MSGLYPRRSKSKYDKLSHQEICQSIEKDNEGTSDLEIDDFEKQQQQHDDFFGSDSGSDKEFPAPTPKEVEMIDESELESDTETKSRKRKKFIHPRRNSKIASPDFFESSPSKNSRNDFEQPSTSNANPSDDQNMDFGFDLEDEPPIGNQVKTSKAVENTMPRTPDIVKTPKK